MVQGVFDLIFGCKHRELSRAFTTNNETYKVCLECGKHLRYSWQTMSLVRERPGRNVGTLKDRPKDGPLNRTAG